MVKTQVKAIKADIAKAPKKGEIAEGTITEISTGLAEDFMTPEQIDKRMCNPEDPYVEVKISVEGTTVTQTYKDYTAIGEGLVSPNTDLGRLLSVTDLETESKLSMIATSYEKGERSIIVWNPVLG